MIRDVQYALRMLLRNPWFTAAAVTTMALAISANTAVFSVVNTILFPHLGFQDSDRLVRIVEEGNRINVLNYDDWWQETDFFESVAGYKVKVWHFSGVGEPVRIPGYSISRSFLNVLQVQPFLGRNLES